MNVLKKMGIWLLENLKQIIKTLIVVFIFSVIGLIFFRIWSADYCPKDMKKLHFTAELVSEYKENSENFKAYEQKIRIYYDDTKEGNFFALNTITVPSADALQTVVRFNDSVARKFQELYSMSGDVADMFSYSVFACEGSDGDEGYRGETYSDYEIVYDEFMMYTYAKVCFDDIELDGVYWVRLDVFLNNEENTKVGSIVVYENNEKYSEQKEIKISKSELPK